MPNLNIAQIELIFCEKCKQYKPDDEFHTKKGDHIYSACRDCRRTYSRQWMRKSRGVPHIVVWELLMVMLGKQCARCGYNDFPSALEIIDPASATKISNVINAFVYKSSTGNWEYLMDEVDRHILLCANCHRALRAEGWSVDELDPAKVGPYNHPPMPTAPQS